MCEQNFLTLVGLLFIFLAHPKKTNQKKRVQGGYPLVDPPGLCAFCTCGTKVVREAASLLFLCVARTLNSVGAGVLDSPF